ncbi:unnamed protein product [Sphagnum balticum]
MTVRTGKLVDALPAEDIVNRDALIELLAQSKTHQYQYVRRNADKRIEMEERKRSSACGEGIPSRTKDNQQFEKKLIGNTEAACLIVAAAAQRSQILPMP